MGGRGSSSGGGGAGGGAVKGESFPDSGPDRLGTPGGITQRQHDYIQSLQEKRAEDMRELPFRYNRKIEDWDQMDKPAFRSEEYVRVRKAEKAVERRFYEKYPDSAVRHSHREEINREVKKARLKARAPEYRQYLEYQATLRNAVKANPKKLTKQQASHVIDILK